MTFGTTLKRYHEEPAHEHVELTGTTYSVFWKHVLPLVFAFQFVEM